MEEKTTGVEMCPLMETELLTVKDPPVLSMTPKPVHTPHEKSRYTVCWYVRLFYCLLVCASVLLFVGLCVCLSVCLFIYII